LVPFYPKKNTIKQAWLVLCLLMKNLFATLFSQEFRENLWPDFEAKEEQTHT